MKRTTSALLTAALGLTLAGCSTGGTTTPAAPGTDSPTGATTTAAGPLTVTDAWAKAAPDPAKKMTGVFGTITNTTDKPVTILQASSDASAVTELHQTVVKAGANVMQKVDGGFVVDPGGSRELRPGGDHVMLMQLAAPLTPGQTVKITLTTADGQKVTFEAVAKTYTGGDEKYHTGAATPGGSSSPSTGEAPMPGMSETTAPTDSPS